MPLSPPRLCRCGNIVPSGQRCACQADADRARKARHDRRRPSARDRGYNNEWRKARAAYLQKHPHCTHPGCNTPASHVDHITPHKGDDRLFWDQANWQALCAHHHNSTKQREERRLTSENQKVPSSREGGSPEAHAKNTVFEVAFADNAKGRVDKASCEQRQDDRNRNLRVAAAAGTKLVWHSPHNTPLESFNKHDRISHVWPSLARGGQALKGFNS